MVDGYNRSRGGEEGRGRPRVVLFSSLLFEGKGEKTRAGPSNFLLGIKEGKRKGERGPVVAVTSLLGAGRSSRIEGKRGTGEKNWTSFFLFREKKKGHGPSTSFLREKKGGGGKKAAADSSIFSSRRKKRRCRRFDRSKLRKP